MAILVRKNDRREVRRAISLPCQIVREKDFRLIAETALDVSPDGMLIATEMDLDPGENVFVSFRATELGLWFDSEAKVARVVRGRRPGDKGKGRRHSLLDDVEREALHPSQPSAQDAAAARSAAKATDRLVCHDPGDRLMKIAKPLFDYARRNATRREVTLPCQAVREHDFKLIADRIFDLSSEGMFVPLKRCVLTGESIIVSFQIPGMWIDAEATVARIVHNRRPGDDGLAAGLVFDGLAPAARAALAGYLHGKKEPLPRRGPLAALRRGAEAAPQARRRSRDGDARSFRPRRSSIHEDEDVVDDDVDAVGFLRAVASAWLQLGI